MIEMPPSFVQVDEASLEGQRSFIHALRAQLILLMLAGILSAFVWSAGSLNLAALGAGLAFAVAALLRLDSISGVPQKRWYEGRAAAESIKTIAWRFAVGGDPFSIDKTSSDALYLEKVAEVTRDLRAVNLVLSADDVTPTMKALRAAALDERRRAYLSERISDQNSWYAGKAEWNRGRARLWGRIVLIAEVAGALGAFLMAFGVIDVDLFGLAGAAAASAAAWLETKQHSALSNAYAVAAAELESIRHLGSTPSTETEWAAYVAQAEEAISREHTLWRARTSART